MQWFRAVMSSLERHALVWLTDAGWSAAIAAARPEHQAALAQWHRQDWPVVVRRLDVDAADVQRAVSAFRAFSA